jgi:threonine dehydrogenase-like Zn-dependent dehydrogenase
VRGLGLARDVGGRLDAERDARARAGQTQAPLRVALVGAGLVGQAAHAITLAEDRARFEFVAVVDPSPTVRTGVAARYGVPHAVGTLAEASGLVVDAGTTWM